MLMFFEVAKCDLKRPSRGRLLVRRLEKRNSTRRKKRKMIRHKKRNMVQHEKRRLIRAQEAQPWPRRKNV